MSGIESLHSYTTLSDGLLSHKETFELAENLDYGVLAFTDHDALPDTATLSYLETLRGHKTRWIMGIEFTSGLPSDAPKHDGYSLHIVGLFVDPTDAALLAHCKKTQEARVEKALRIVENLTRIGFDITKEDVLANAKGDSVGMPHIVAVINQKPKNRERVRAIMEDFERSARSDARLAALYEETLRRGEAQWPYALFFNTNRYVPDVTAQLSYKVNLDESVKLIRNAGGLAIIAHYYFLGRDVLTIPYTRELLLARRIDGMETQYVMPQGLTPETFETERREVERIAKETGAIATGGADAHSEKDLRDFAENKKISHKTIGMTARILEQRPDISKHWSSL